MASQPEPTMKQYAEVLFSLADSLNLAGGEIPMSILGVMTANDLIRTMSVNGIKFVWDRSATVRK